VRNEEDHIERKSNVRDLENHHRDEYDGGREYDSQRPLHAARLRLKVLPPIRQPGSTRQGVHLTIVNAVAPIRNSAGSRFCIRIRTGKRVERCTHASEWVGVHSIRAQRYVAISAESVFPKIVFPCSAGARPRSLSEFAGRHNPLLLATLP